MLAVVDQGADVRRWADELVTRHDLDPTLRTSLSRNGSVAPWTTGGSETVASRQCLARDAAAAAPVEWSPQNSGSDVAIAYTR